MIRIFIAFLNISVSTKIGSGNRIFLVIKTTKNLEEKLKCTLLPFALILLFSLVLTAKFSSEKGAQRGA